MITPSLVNNFIGGASWYTAIFGVADFQKANSLMPERFVFGDGGANGGANSGVFTTVGATFPNGRNVGQLQLIDDVAWTKGRHTIKAGVNYRYNKVTATNLSANTVEGTYTFNDLTDFATGQINSTGKGSSFSQTFSLLGAAHIRAYSLNFYAQDEWNVTHGLKLTYGMRFERDGNPACVDNCFNRLTPQFGTSGYQGGIDIPYNQTIATGLHNAYHGLEAVISEPRFGFVYTPFGPNKTVLRGGIGLFANLFSVSVANNIDTNSPGVFSPSVPFGRVGLTTDPSSSVSSALASFNAFESGFKQGFTVAQIRQALGKISFALPNYYSPPQNFVAPKVVEWSFEIEQPLSQHNVLAMTYSGNHGYDQAVTNILPNGFIASNSIYAKTGYSALPLSPPDPRFLQVSQVRTSGYSNYDALIVQIRHAFSFGFQGQAGYTWSHALGILTNNSSNLYLWNPFNLGANYGPLNFDTRHMLTGDVIWTEPYTFENRVLNMIAGGWTLGGKLYVYSGPPFSAYDSAINAQINSAGGLGSNNILADLTDPSIFGKSCHSISGPGNSPCFTVSQFATRTVQKDLGNTSPNIFRGPGYFDIDAQVTKNFKLAERATLGLGLQAYNLLNHPNFSNPSGSVTSSALGLITSTVVPPTSIYGSFQSGTVSGRVVVLLGKLTF